MAEEEEFGVVTKKPTLIKKKEIPKPQIEEEEPATNLLEQVDRNIEEVDDTSLAIIGQLINAEIIERNLHLSPSVYAIISRLKRCEEKLSITVPENEKLYWDYEESEEEDEERN